MATILVCTHGEDLLAEVGPLLRSEHRVAIVPHVADVVRCLLLTRVDAVVLDLDEDLGQHIDVLPVISQLNPRIPIVTVSTAPPMEVEAAIRAAGVFCFLSRPLAAGELEQRLAAGLRWRATEPNGSPGPHDANAAAAPAS